MYSIQVMEEEHENIRRMLKVVRNACLLVFKGQEIDYSDFDKMIDFIKNYADIHHHGKEEKFLFAEMTDKLGRIGENLIIHGMLVEHEWGRLFVSDLKDALARVREGDEDSKVDVIANAIGYVNHLERHIGKENLVIYPFAEKQLDQVIKDMVDQQTAEFEEMAFKNNIQKTYQELLIALEKKYS
ncbi:MAG: hemerythrin domain-containing protein [Clostridiales bacterium]|nr:hemerythrin domain-containing protein [Clostridiales bacterium]